MPTIERWAAGANLWPNTTDYPEYAEVRARGVLWFDGATDQEVGFQTKVPQGVTTALTLVLMCIARAATTGQCRFQASVEAITVGTDTTDIDAGDSYDTANSAGSGTVPGTVGIPFEISIPLTNADSYAAGDLMRILLRRDADGTSGTDDITTDVGVLEVELRAA